MPGGRFFQQAIERDMGIVEVWRDFSIIVLQPFTRLIGG
jgi:hypothetical protein